MWQHYARCYAHSANYTEIHHIAILGECDNITLDVMVIVLMILRDRCTHIVIVISSSRK